MTATGIAKRTVQEINAKLEGRVFTHKDLTPKDKVQIERVKKVAPKRTAESDWLNEKSGADSIPGLPNMYG